MELLADPYFHPYAEQDNQLSVQRLIELGILLCAGSVVNKAEAFWRLLQAGSQSFISANDKDFLPAFQDMIELSIFLLKNFAKDKTQN